MSLDHADRLPELEPLHGLLHRQRADLHEADHRELHDGGGAGHEGELRLGHDGEQGLLRRPGVRTWLRATLRAGLGGGRGGVRGEVDTECDQGLREQQPRGPEVGARVPAVGDGARQLVRELGAYNT